MRWRWLILDYVDPALDIPRAERAKIRRAALRRLKEDGNMRWQGWGRTPWRWWLAMGQSLVPAAFMLPYIVWFPFQGTVGLEMLLALPVFLALQIAGTTAAMGILTGFIVGRSINAELARRGYPVCYDCGYRLDGIESSAPCPECGAPRR